MWGTMERLPTTDMVALDILKTLLSGESLTASQISRKVDAAPQTVRNALVHLKATSLVKRVGWEYTITELGKEVWEANRTPPVQSSRRRE